MDTRKSSINFIEKDKFELKGWLGRGEFGVVRQGEYAGAEVAIKIGSPVTSEEEAVCKTELEIMKQLTDSDAPHTIDLLAHGYHNKQYYLVMTLAERGALSSLLGYLTVSQQYDIMLGIAKALAHLHGLGWVHCDIKPDNVLLAADYSPLLCDFGLARRQSIKGKKPRGTPIHMAPELLGKRASNSVETDIFSLGLLLNIILINLAAKQSPYFDQEFLSISELRKWVDTKKNRPQIPPYAPTELALLIKLAWEQKPSKRPDAKQVCESLKRIEREIKIVQKLDEQEKNNSTDLKSSPRLFHSTGFKKQSHDESLIFKKVPAKRKGIGCVIF